MKLTDGQREEIRQAVFDMALANDDDAAVRAHADRVVFWLEKRDDIKAGDPR